MNGLFRIGHGYDVHRLVADRALIIGGVEIPWPLGLCGHSDADVLLHAVCDALLGAAGLGDIGRHFPPGDSRYRDTDSRQFVRTVAALMARQDWQIGNLDCTIIAEQPVMQPHIPAMQHNIAADLGVQTDQVNVKATTTDGLGFEGTGQGIAATATALIYHR